MAPKKKDNGEKKAEEKKRDKCAADKTFGLKNKNKSKQVQKFVNQVQNAAKNAHRAGRPVNENDEKKKAKSDQQQKALLASLFGMAADKKGRVFDPNAKKKAKEKNMEEERAGANVDEEYQQKLVEGIKNAIRLTNAKGTNLSMIGGSLYVKDVLDDKEYGKKLQNLSLLHFIRRRKNDFWISDEEREAETTNPSVRCQEDVMLETNKDERDMFLILEEKRQQWFGDASLARVTVTDLKAWWEKSAALEPYRDPDTGELIPENERKPIKKVVKKTGEELFRGGKVKVEVEVKDEDVVIEKVERNKDDEEEDEEETKDTNEEEMTEEERKKFDPAPRVWGAVTEPKKSAGEVEVEVNAALFAAAAGDLPDDLDELDDD